MLTALPANFTNASSPQHSSPEDSASNDHIAEHVPRANDRQRSDLDGHCHREPIASIAARLADPVTQRTAVREGWFDWSPDFVLLDELMSSNEVVVWE